MQSRRTQCPISSPHLLVALVLLLITKSVRQMAEKRMSGVEGRITLFARLLPLIPLGFFSTFAVYALQDPDPDDRIAGVCVLVCAVLLLCGLIYYWTFRLVLNDEWILTQFLIGSDRIIYLSQPFELIVDSEIETLHPPTGWQNAQSHLDRLRLPRHPRPPD